MFKPVRSLLGIVALMLACAATNAMAQASDATKFPDRPVKIIITFPPGGPGDLLARQIANRLKLMWDQTVLVDNRPGGNSVIGTEAGARSAPDGYTLLEATIGAFGVNPFLYKNLPYDPIKDFAPVTGLATQALLIAVRTESPIRSLADLVAQAKANPGKLTFATGGNGQGGHLAGSLFEIVAGVKMIHVPYKGSAPAVVDTLGGHVDLTFDGIANTLAHVRSGKLRPIAVTTRNRSPVAPEIPTVAELGYPGFDVGSWFGMVAPAGVPPAIVRKTSTAIQAILREPETARILANAGLTPIPSSPEEFGAFLQAELSKWGEVVKVANIKGD